MKYEFKAVIFDLMEECEKLKEDLISCKVAVLEPLVGVSAKETLRKAVLEAGLLPEECLLLTNREKHHLAGKELGMVVVGCVESHYTIPTTRTVLEEAEEVSPTYLNLCYCHERGLPAEIFSTARTIVRELCLEDAEDMYTLLSDPEVACRIPELSSDKETEIQKIRAYTEQVYPFFEYGYWGVFMKNSGELIGRAGFKEGSYPPEIGYIIRRDVWRKGYASEVVAGLVSYAKQELCAEQVVMQIEKDNPASLHVAEKSGFVATQENYGDKIQMHLR